MQWQINFFLWQWIYEIVAAYDYDCAVQIICSFWSFHISFFIMKLLIPHFIPFELNICFPILSDD